MTDPGQDAAARNAQKFDRYWSWIGADWIRTIASSFSRSAALV